MAKTTEIIYDGRRTHQHTPPPLPGITRVDTLRVLGVTLTRRLSASAYIRRAVSDCSRTLYVLSHHGLTDVKPGVLSPGLQSFDASKDVRIR